MTATYTGFDERDVRAASALRYAECDFWRAALSPHRTFMKGLAMSKILPALLVCVATLFPKLASAHQCGDLSGRTVPVASVDILLMDHPLVGSGETVRIQALADTSETSSVVSNGDGLGFLSDGPAGHAQSITVRVKDASPTKCGTYRIEFDLVAGAAGSACGVGTTTWMRSTEISTCAGGVASKGVFIGEVSHWALGSAAFANRIRVFRDGVLWASKDQCFTVWGTGCSNCCNVGG